MQGKEGSQPAGNRRDRGGPSDLSGTVWRLGVCHRGQGGLWPRTEVQQKALFTRGWVGPEIARRAAVPGVAEQGLRCRELGKIRVGMWL